MGLEIRVDDSKSDKKTNLLAIMCMRLCIKLACTNGRIGLNFKKETAINNAQKVITITAEFISCYMRTYYYHGQENVFLLRVGPVSLKCCFWEEVVQ